MSNFTATRLGQVNTAGDDRALFLKQFAGEVLTAFYTKSVTLDKHTIRTIPNGKSASFPVSGQGTAQYHTPGTELTGTTIPFAEQIINIDDKLVADRFVADIDEAMIHYDVRSILTTDMGAQLARAWDKNVLQLGVLAARAASPVTGGNGGSIVVSANAKTDAAALRQALLDSAQAFANKDVPQEDVYAYVRPAQYYLLVNDAKLTNRDYVEGNGSVASGTIGGAAGFPIVMTNNLPVTNVNTGLSKYQVNASNTAALVMGKPAVGTVKLMDLSMQQEDSVRHQGTLLVARYAIGHGILRPDCSCEIATA